MKATRLAVLAAASLALGACDLSVENPGPIPDAELNTPGAMPALVNGMSADLSVAVDLMARYGSVLSDELAHSGNYAAEGYFYRGVVPPENVNDVWGDMQRARWVAEHGIGRLKEVLGSGFEASPLAIRANLYAGYANRVLGENVCDAVIDNGSKQAYTEHFKRAETYFTEALRLAQAQNNTALANAALAGRAQVRADLGNWDGAAQDAALVPTSFRFDAVYSTNTERENNSLAYETQTRREYTVYNTQWAANSSKDPRVPWDTIKTSAGKLQTGQDGKTPFFRQMKYKGLDAEIPLAKGAEMLLIRAEAALRKGDVPGALALVNQERASYGLAPAIAATLADAWPLLQKERGAVTWLETRRLGDLRRWFTASGPEKNNFLQGRATCVPISDEEMHSNPNLAG
ncbi:MAG TPA: RagB/SusD family nutrient uptake outer membrane protein [Longimicrobiales bacterium]|nr:RagB/SusD family nutrient uptake outer membrane protein [Longimicrobiales bacterium]